MFFFPKSVGLSPQSLFKNLNSEHNFSGILGLTVYYGSASKNFNPKITNSHICKANS